MNTSLAKKNHDGLQLCLLLALLYFTSYITRLNFSASMAEIISAGVLTKTQAGTIGTALFFTYGFGQLVSGALSDRFPANRIICTGLIITIGCNILMPLASAPWLMTVVWGFNGFAQAMFWPPIVKLMASYLDEDGYARGNWLVSVACHAATILIYIAVPACITWLDWRWAFFLAAAFAAFMLTIWVLGFSKIQRKVENKQETPSASHTDVEKKTDTAENAAGSLARKFMISGPFVCILAAVAMQGFLKDGVQSWLPTFFTEVFSMGTSTAILSNMVLPIFNIIVVSVATVLYQKVFRNEAKEALALFTCAIIFCMLLAMTFESSPWLCLILAALITGSMHGINCMFISFLPRRFDSCGKVATASGVCNACSYMGSAISSYGIALIAEKLGWKLTLLSWGAVALCGVVLCLVVLKPWTTFIKRQAEAASTEK